MIFKESIKAEMKRLSASLEAESLVEQLLGDIEIPRCLLLWCLGRKLNSRGHNFHCICNPLIINNFVVSQQKPGSLHCNYKGSRLESDEDCGASQLG